MNKNEIYEITIEDIGNDGEGIGRVAQPVGSCEGKQSADRTGITVFVKDTVVGDVARVKIIKVKKSYAYGRLVEIVKPSKLRVKAACANARRCGGCTLMHMAYEKQLEYKWNKVKNCLVRIGGVTDAEALMEPLYGMDSPYHFRNKMQFPVGQNCEGEVVIGFYAGHTHSIIDLEECAIGHPVNQYIIRHMREWLTRWQEKTGDFIYDEEAHRGLIRHILTRVGFVTGEVMVCVVINGDGLSRKDGSRTVKSSESIAAQDLLGCLQEAVEEYRAHYRSDKSLCLASVCININKEKTNRILGNTCRTLWGRDYITDYIGENEFRISPLSFYQVNPVQTKRLYDKALEYAGLTGDEVVWDMYCGIGTISLSMAKRAKQVYGVELVPQAIEDAKINACINGISNVEFFCGRAEEVVPDFYNRTADGQQDGEGASEAAAGRINGSHPDVIVVDPPRKGCDRALLDTIGEMAPERLVYVSCDPATLARDVKVLAEKGLCVKKVAVYDQFSHSTHVETVCLLTRK